MWRAMLSKRSDKCKNLINLADVYKKLEQPSKSLHLIEKVLVIEPSNRNAIKLKEILSQRIN